MSILLDLPFSNIENHADFAIAASQTLESFERLPLELSGVEMVVSSSSTGTVEKSKVDGGNELNLSLDELNPQVQCSESIETLIQYIQLLLRLLSLLPFFLLLLLLDRLFPLENSCEGQSDVTEDDPCSVDGKGL